MKADASSKVRRLEEDWQADAELLGVVPQLSGLTRATSKALVALPYPSIRGVLMVTLGRVMPECEDRRRELRR